MKVTITESVGDSSRTIVVEGDFEEVQAILEDILIPVSDITCTKENT